MTQNARIQQMLEYLPVEELDPEDIEFLRWIAGWGDSTADKLIRIIQKCRENPFRKKDERPHEPASSGNLEINQLYFSRKAVKSEAENSKGNDRQ